MKTSAGASGEQGGRHQCRLVPATQLEWRSGKRTTLAIVGCAARLALLEPTCLINTPFNGCSAAAAASTGETKGNIFFEWRNSVINELVPH